MVLIILGALLAGGVGAFTGLVLAYNSAGGPRYTPEISVSRSSRSIPSACSSLALPSA